jgi:AbrB family looped-hinge helix DNA binding protein
MQGPVKNGLNAKARLNPNGRIVIPAAIREQMGVKPGEWLYMDFEDGALRIETFPARIRRIQREAAKYIEPGVSAVDELIAERREEARREEEETQRWLEEGRLRKEGKIA